MLERLTALIVEKRRPAVLPRLPGNGRTSVPGVYKQPDPTHGTWGEALLEGALEAANSVRREQSRAPLSGSDSLLRRVLTPLERRCATDDPKAFLELAHEYDIAVPAVRTLRHNYTHHYKRSNRFGKADLQALGTTRSAALRLMCLFHKHRIQKSTIVFYFEYCEGT